MADKMYIVITARKEVPDRETGQAVYEYVKQKMIDRPDIKITGHLTNHFDSDQN